MKKGENEFHAKNYVEINTGDARKDYPYGDFLNAVDEIVCYFQHIRDDFDLDIAAKHLVLYSENMMEG